MNQLTKDQAIKISEITSEIFRQGDSWVLKVLDLDSGVHRLTRNLTEKSAKNKLKNWRREKVEQLLRSSPQASAYTLRTWHENPSWNGEGVWQWTQNHWYTTLNEAQSAMEKINENSEICCEVFETVTAKVPGHFVVA